jgi:methyl-accepting chemotaxis protein
MKLNDLKLGLRLALGFTLVLALVPVIAGLGWWRLQATQAELEHVASIEARALSAAQWKSLTHLNVTRTLAIAKSGGHKDVQAYFEPLMKETTAQITALQKPLEAGAGSEDEKALIADIAGKRKQYLSTRSAIFGLLDIDDPGAKEALESRLMPIALSYIATISSYQDWQQKQAEAALVTINQRVDQAQWVTIGLTLLCLLIGTGCAWVITHSVTRPLERAAAAARTMAGGDLSQPIACEGRDEVSELLAGLQHMQASLHGVISGLRHSALSIRSSSSEVAGGSQDLSSRTEQAAASLQQTASSMEQLSGNVRQNAESARTANQLVASAAVAATRGGEVVSQVVATMEQISSSSSRIADIIGVIDGIAFQTNILALNAAVEAARAGEQGRGFAVVASEVRSLAQRSAEAAREIKALIGASVETVEGGTSLVRHAGESMNDIVASVKRVSDIIGEITAASSEQSDGIGQVNAAVSQLDQMTQQNAALVEESAAAAESLSGHAVKLAEAVALFRLSASEAEPLPA